MHYKPRIISLSIFYVKLALPDSGKDDGTQRLVFCSWISLRRLPSRKVMELITESIVRKGRGYMPMNTKTYENDLTLKRIRTDHRTASNRSRFTELERLRVQWGF